MVTTLWNKNKVFILGLLGAIALAIQPFASNTNEEVKWKVIGFAALVATTSYFARNWRGQSVSILNIIGQIAAAITIVLESGNFRWDQMILQIIIGAIAFAAPDPKSRGYEHTATIKDAKKEGEQIVPAQLTTKPKE